MKFALKSATTHPEQWLQEIRALPPGVGGFTLDCAYPWLEVQAGTLGALRDAREERGLDYFVHTPVGRIKLGHPEAGLRQDSAREVKRAIELAGHVGARLVTVHPTPWDDRAGWSEDDLKWREREAFVELCAHAAHHNVSVALENMPSGGSFHPGYSDFSSHLELLEAVEGLGITLDVGHAHVAGVSLSDVTGRLGRRLRHVHVHDNDGSGDQHLPVGHGTVDWAFVLRVLAQARYQGCLELEIAGRTAQMASVHFLEKLAESLGGEV